MSRINRGIAVFLIYSAMAFAAWLPHSLHPGTSITDSWDGCLNAWILNWNLHQMDTGFPGGLTGYFNGNIMAPHPSTLAYSEHMLGVALAAWPLHRLVVPGNPLVIFNIMHLLSYILCAGAMYLFIRRIGGSAPAGFAAGIMWAFSPWRYSQHGHFQLMSLYWLPLTLWALTAWIRTGKRRWPIAAAVFHLMQILSSYYLAVFHGVAIALYSIAVCIAPPVPGARKRLGIALMVLAGASLLILPVTWPYFDIHESLAIGETEATVRALSAHPAMYLLPQPSGPVYRALLNVRNPGRYPPEQQVFPGFIVLAGAVIACVAALRRRRKSSAGRSAAAGFALLLILSGFVLSLGPGPDGGPVLPFHWFSRFVPGFGVVRVPARFAVLVQTGLVIAAAIGLDLAMRRPRNRRWIAGLAGIAVFLETAIWPAPSTRLEMGSQPPAPYDILAAEPDGGPVAEFPFEHQKYREMLYSCYHWRPLINGTSGYLPPGRAFIENHLNHFPGGLSLDLLACLGVRDLIIHDNQPEWNHGTIRRGDFRLTPRQAADAGWLYRLSIDPPAPARPIVLCDMPSRILVNTPHLMRLHIINPRDHDILCPAAELTWTLKLDPETSLRRDTRPDNLVFNETMSVEFPEILPAGSIWTAECGLPARPAAEALAAECRWTVTGPLGWSGTAERDVLPVTAFTVQETAVIDPQSVHAVWTNRVIDAGAPMDLTLLIENTTDMLWTRDSRLLPPNGTLRFAWVPEHLYPGNAAVWNGTPFSFPSPPLIPRGDAMPGTHAFCPVTIQPPPWPGEYRLTLDSRPLIRCVFLGPERSLPAGTCVILHQNPDAAGNLTDGRRDTVWQSNDPVYADTGIHLDFGRPRRVQGLRLVTADPALPPPEAPSILISDDGVTWQRIVPESRRLSDPPVQDVWFPPLLTRHLAVHAGVMMRHPWSISEITLL